MSMRIPLALAALCTSLALADDAPLPQPRLQLDKGHGAILAPQGDRVLWFERVDGEFTYFVSGTKGKALEPTKVVAVHFSSDDMLSYTTNGGVRQWAPDSSRFGFATQVEGVTRGGIAQLDGTTQTLEDTDPEAEVDTHSVCFAPQGGGGWYVEGSMRGRPLGAKIHAFDGEGQRGELVFEAADKVLLMLEPSPDGERLAFMLADREGLRVALLELKTKALVTSEPVRTDDHFGKPRLHWTPDSRALVFTARGERGKWPADIVRCDAATAKLTTLVDESRWAVAGITREGRVSVVNRQDDELGLLDPETGECVDAPLAVLQSTPRRSLLFVLEPRGWWLD